MSPVLSAAELDRIERLAWHLDRPVSGHFAGLHRSRRRGRSLDFADWRPYVEGDDPRDIDVQLWARLDQLLVRLYEADVDLTVQLLVDTSASMGFGSKLDQARRIAAALGVATLVRNQGVSVATLDGRAPRRFRGRTAVPALLATIGGWSAVGPTALAARARQLLRTSRPSGIVVVVSDFLTSEWSGAIDLLGARREPLLAICVRSGADEAIDLAGEVQLVDVETGETVDVDLSPQAWRDLVERRAALRAAISRRVARTDGRYVEVRDDADLLRDVVPALLGTGALR